ncbi:ParB N-terminal domain-containing protein [Pseudovibrio ascidiaceicola]|uniref:ParB/RepB/Spo0J family partition protein n=1 Tax=Pseudovibrio ascidiaceicola TaxID=285279 RepID=UPI003D360F1D
MTTFISAFEDLAPNEARELLEEKRQTTTITNLKARKDYPVCKVRIVPVALQPRQCESEAHVSTLRMVLKAVKELDPILVLPADDKVVVVDGHHRLTAYEMEGRKHIPVVFWTGTVHDAVLEAARRNSKPSLTLSSRERADAAWGLNLMNKFSKTQITASTSVGKSTIDRQREVIKLLKEHGQNPHKIKSWFVARKEAERLVAGEPKNEQYTDEMKQEKAAKLSQAMAKSLPKNYLRDPECFALAVKMLSGRQAIEVLKLLAEECLNDSGLKEAIESDIAEAKTSPEELASIADSYLRIVDTVVREREDSDF